MLAIGEKINVMSKSIGAAMKERDPVPVIEMARRQVDAGADVLDINLGPATRNGEELMQWVVDLVQLAVPDTRLCLDTTNPQAMRAGLERCKLQPIINSTSAESARLETYLPMAAEFEAEIIGLAMTEAGVSRDVEERLVAATTIMAAMDQYDIPVDRLYLDPLLLPVAVAQAQAEEALTSITMFKQLSSPAPKTVVGLSNIYNGCPEHTRSPLAAAYLTILIPAGLDAAIMDADDELQMAAARGRTDGHDRAEDLTRSLSVLKNETLYCHSYLD